MQCPNYKVCQTMVPANKRGDEHKYGVYNHEKKKVEYVWCNGG